MKIVRVALLCVVIILVVTVIRKAESTEAPFHSSATPGVRHYRYTSVERATGQPERRYRIDFDLVTGADHSVVAVIRKAESATGDVWSTPTVDAECQRALHGHGSELARVTLAPLSPEAASLGEAFMPMCAPAAYFFPLTDILNISLIQTQPTFHLADLTAPGRSARFEGFQTKFDRLGVAIAASSPGGEIKLSALDRQSATVDWTPDPMQIEIVHHAAQGTPEVQLRGVERFAFRLEIDPASGALRRAATTHDNLDLVVNVPGISSAQAPHLTVTREVVIDNLK